MDPKQFVGKERYEMEDLRAIMALLRGEGGCPWDREQTHASIRNNLIEETYEAVEAIDTDNPVLLREELGDVLLQVVFHAQMEEEAGRFTLSDVIHDECVKLITRHPHIFGDFHAENSREVLAKWEDIKAVEKGRATPAQELAGISAALPSLLRAGKLMRKADKRGLLPAAGEMEQPESRESIGNKLMEVVLCAYRSGVEPEQALYDACERFVAKAAEKEQNDHEEKSNSGR